MKGDLKVKKVNVWRRFFILMSTVVIGFGIAIVLLMQFSLNSLVKTTLIANNELLAKHIVEKLDTKGYEQLVDDPKESDVYYELQKNLTDILSYNTITYLYIVTASPVGKNNMVLVDAGDLSSEDTYQLGDEADEVDYTRIVEMIELENDLYSEIVESEGWGTFLSTYAPIRDSKGNIIAVLGIDE